MRELQLSKGQLVLLDDEIYELARKYRWYAKRYNKTGKVYAVRKTSRKDHLEHKQQMLAMHRWIMGLEIGSGRLVDHINGNTLDNRKCNLRIATIQENNRNMKLRKNKSGFRGVKKELSGRWSASINLGCYDTPEEAARVYDTAARQFHGVFATTNFPFL